MMIRDATVADAGALAALLAELGYPDEEARVAARVEQFARDPASRFLVVEKDGAVVGLAAATVLPLAHEDGVWCRLSALVVAEAARRGGAGRALVAAVEAEARDRGCRRIEVTSGERPERDAAHGFYDALGYEQVSKRYLKELV
jgi:N-acetylglutamate synthase-like GNAT family acetyltransferase